MKTVYHHGKGICPQGTSWSYTFSVRIPSELSPEVSTIFAQWHGMPDRTLVDALDGRVSRKLPAEEFLAMQDTVVYQEGHGLRAGGNRRQEGQQRSGKRASRRAGRSSRAAIPRWRSDSRDGYFRHRGQLRPPLVHRQDRPLQRQPGQSPGDGARHLGVQSLDDRRADAFRGVPQGPLGDLHRGDRLDASTAARPRRSCVRDASTYGWPATAGPIIWSDDGADTR